MEISELVCVSMNGDDVIRRWCSFSATQMMGEYNRGIYVLFSGLDIERCVLSGGALG